MIQRVSSFILFSFFLCGFFSGETELILAPTTVVSVELFIDRSERHFTNLKLQFHNLIK